MKPFNHQGPTAPSVSARVALSTSPTANVSGCRPRTPVVAWRADKARSWTYGRQPAALLATVLGLRTNWPNSGMNPYPTYSKPLSTRSTARTNWPKSGQPLLIDTRTCEVDLVVGHICHREPRWTQAGSHRTIVNPVHPTTLPMRRPRDDLKDPLPALRRAANGKARGFRGVNRHATQHRQCNVCVSAGQSLSAWS